MGSPVTWKPTRKVSVATGFDESDYCEYDEFVFYENQQIESFFPRGGGATDGAQISLSESTDMATLFLSNDVVLRLDVDGVEYDFTATLSNGIGMLSGFHKLGIYEISLPFGMYIMHQECRFCTSKRSRANI